MNSMNSDIYTVTFNPCLDQIIIFNKLNIGEANFGNKLTPIAAGKGLNVSNYLSCMNIHSTVFAFMTANDQEFFSKQLEKSNISCVFEIIPGVMRTNMTLLDESTNVDTHIVTKGFTIDVKEEEKFLERIEKYIKKGDFIVFSGSYPDGFDFDVFNRFLKKLEEKNVIFLFDNNGKNLRKLELPINSFKKPNLNEYQEWKGEKFDDLPSLVKYLKENSENNQNLLISLGKEGVMYIRKMDEKIIHCKLKPKKIVSSVGCGDAVLSGFLYGLIGKKSCEECVKLSIAFAVSKLGNHHVGKIDIKEVDELMDQIEIFRY